MEDIRFVQTGIQLIAESVGNHQEAVRGADETFDDGFTHLINAQNLLRQAVAEITLANKCFEDASSLLGKSTRESLLIAQNTAKAIELKHLGQEPAIRLDKSLGYLASLTGALLGFHKNNKAAVSALESLLEKSNTNLTTHLDATSGNTTAYSIDELCNVMRDVSGQIQL